jgi:hypothetical protein
MEAMSQNHRRDLPNKIERDKSSQQERRPGITGFEKNPRTGWTGSTERVWPGLK